MIGRDYTHIHRAREPGERVPKMNHKIARHFTEAKTAREERKHVCGGSAHARAASRAYNRASRRAARVALRAEVQS